MALALDDMELDDDIIQDIPTSVATPAPAE